MNLASNALPLKQLYRDGNVYALDAGSGIMQWKFSAGGPVETGIVLGHSPSGSDDALYVLELPVTLTVV